MDDYKKQEKWEARQEKYDAQAEKRKKRQERWDRNIIAVVGFVLAANAFVISFTGWHVWLSLVALVCCLIGVGRNRPSNWKKLLAYIGIAVSMIAIINAVRVSNAWVYEGIPETDLPQTTIKSTIDQN
jgi:predicted histidine transporter YuiF (NhaC family)